MSRSVASFVLRSVAVAAFTLLQTAGAQNAPAAGGSQNAAAPAGAQGAGAGNEPNIQEMLKNMPKIPGN